MEALITRFNTIQDQFRLLNKEPIELPQIVVVGIQSAGKSSVLEAIVGHSFLPRGTDTVTRCPLIIQLHNCPLKDELRARKGTEFEEWGEFAHAEGRIFAMADIEAEIEAQTSKIAGRGKAISTQKIILRIFSPRVTYLTIIDLPGITLVPVGGQAEDIEEQTRALILTYISNPLSIILAVVPANMDMGANNGLKLAKEVDPTGSRTVAVVTKLDLMDEGTDARKILNGEVVPVALGIIGVVNRSQKAVENKKSMEDMLKDERNFLIQNYGPQLARRHGTPYLVATLTEMLFSHIRKSVPKVKAKVNEDIRQLETFMKDRERTVEDKRGFLTQVLSEFCAGYCELLEGRHPAFDSSQLLFGGAQLCHIFNSLHRRFASVEPCDAYCLEKVVLMIRNASGPRPPLPFVVSEDVLDDMVRPLVAAFRPTAIDCVMAVVEELNTVFADKFPQDVAQRFPNLHQRIQETYEETLKGYSDTAVAHVNACIDMELAHFTYGSFEELPPEVQSAFTDQVKVEVTEGTALPFKPDQNYVNALGSKLKTGDWDSVQTGAQKAELLDLTEKDRKQTEILGVLLKYYYKVIARKVADSVSKAIMHFIVNSVKRFLLAELVANVVTPEDEVDDLFLEDEATEKDKRDKAEKLMVLKEVSAVLQTIT